MGRRMKSWIFLIFISVHSKRSRDRCLGFYTFEEMCSLKVIVVRSNFVRRCYKPWDKAHLTRPLCLFAALRPLWLVNDDVLSQQTISLLNTSFSLLILPPCRSRYNLSFHPLLSRFAWPLPPSQFGKRESTLCRKCNGTNAAGINVETNVGTWGRSLGGYFPCDDFDAHRWNCYIEMFIIYFERYLIHDDISSLKPVISTQK